MEVMGTLDENL